MYNDNVIFTWSIQYYFDRITLENIEDMKLSVEKWEVLVTLQEFLKDAMLKRFTLLRAVVTSKSRVYQI